MIEIPKPGEEVNTYDGSRAFTWLADMTGLSVDLVNFLVCQVLALFFASFFRSYLHPSKASVGIRHAFGLSLGLVFGYICFGQQAIHIAGLPAACYIIIRTQNPQIVQRLVMFVALVYLSMIHVYRIYYDYGSYSLDITGPLMIITQKVTLLAFSIHDGFARNNNELTKSQQFNAVRKLPTTLEFFAYVWHFQGLMAGPMVMYRDYVEFIEGTNILKHSNGNNNLDKNGLGKEIIVEPSPMKAVVKKVIGSLVCAYIFMKLITVYPIKRLSEDDFIENTSMFYKFWFISMSTTIVRFKYYHAWLLADAICNNSGLGFNGYEKDGNPKWDLISNINVIAFELATNLRDAIGSWNLGTNRWLRLVVYERVPKKYGTFLTFALSALWHGFYPGYYLTFASGALIVTAARTARKLFRYRFQHSTFLRIFYDILTVITNRIFMGYLTFPFILLEFKVSLRLYLTLFACLHLVGFITIYILPRFIRGEIIKKEIVVDSQPTDTTTNTKVPSSTTDTTMTNGLRSNTTADDNKNACDNLINNPVDTNKSTNKLHNANDNENLNDNKNVVTPKNDRVIGDKEKDNLSHMIRKRIDSETRNLEELIDKTVNGIVELKEDLMRVSDDERLAGFGDGLRKRNHSERISDTVDIFLKREINAAVNQVNVLPAVLSNGHGAD